jgi:predicted Kef-type K+ transport protein
VAYLQKRNLSVTEEAGPGRRLIPVMLVAALAVAPSAAIAAEGIKGPSEVLFLGQILALLVCGRLMGELMVRLGQPAVMGQLIAGILLGPSVLDELWPASEQALFPADADQKAMIDAVAQLGILLLLLLTGMETDLSVVRNSRRAAFSTSICGIAIPFLFGFGFGELLPEAMLPDPGRRLITAFSRHRTVDLVREDRGYGRA